MGKQMRGALKLLAALLLGAALAGCMGTGSGASAPGGVSAPGGAQEPGADANAASGAGAANVGPLPELTLVMDSAGCVPNNAHGYFETELTGTTMHSVLMRYDYQTLEQQVVCGIPGCAHDAEPCPAYIGDGSWARPFVYGDKLFLWRKVFSEAGGGRAGVQEDFMELERRNIDGSGAEVLAAFPEDPAGRGLVFTDGSRLFYQDAEGFVSLDMETRERKLVATIPMPTQRTNESGVMEAESYTDILPTSHQGQFVLYRKHADDTSELFLLHPDTGQETPLYDWPSGLAFRFVPSSFTPEGKGYYVDFEKGTVRCLDISTGEDTLVTDQFAPENTPIENPPRRDGLAGETLYPARLWELAGPYGGWLFLTRYPGMTPEAPGEPAMAAYNLKTGECLDVPFRYYANATVRPLYILGETPYGLLVIEDTRTRSLRGQDKDGTPFATDTEYRIYGLIDVEDFAHGVAGFKTIQPKVFEQAA